MLIEFLRMNESHLLSHGQQLVTGQTSKVSRCNFPAWPGTELPPRPEVISLAYFLQLWREERCYHGDDGGRGRHGYAGWDEAMGRSMASMASF